MGLSQTWGTHGRNLCLSSDGHSHPIRGQIPRKRLQVHSGDKGASLLLPHAK